MKFSQHPIHKRARKRGFALIVTLSLMILLTVIAVGLLTLSSISLRTTSQSAAQSVANANAKMALMIAIGDLQKALGPDQRISANASSVIDAPEQPNVVGAWDGFGWIAPTGGPAEPSEKSSKFRKWLISTADIDAASEYTLPSNADGADSIWLTNPTTTGTIGNPGDVDANNPKMRAERVPVSVNNSRGGFAWMVSDNSTAVPLNMSPDNSVLMAENIGNRTAATAPRPDVIQGLEELKNVTNRQGIVSLQTAVLALGGGDEAQKKINPRSKSLTVSSVGLLTDPVNGGLKTDLTPLMEGPPGTNPNGAADTDSPYFQATWGAPSWAYLRNHYQKYKNISNVDVGEPRYALDGTVDVDPTYTSSLVGLTPAPETENLLPVLAKAQIMFSLVTHYSHIGGRINDFNQYAIPKGNTFHAVPHLVYDPVITLYNPYDVELDISKMRVRIWDPPVGFRFQKHDKQAGTNPWLRQEFETGTYHGLARFQIDNERNPNARKYFTLLLQDMDPSGSRKGNMALAPGEVKVFMARVENNWTWGLETRDEWNPRSFFEWQAGRDMGNIDRRTNNNFGVEGINQVDWRAGFQVDHLSYGSGRPTNSKYPFEYDASQNNRYSFGGGWVDLRAGPAKTGPYASDDITVYCKPQRCVQDASFPDFQVDILAGKNVSATQDILRSYQFRLGDVPLELSTGADPAKPISRRLSAYSLLQGPTAGVAGKTPFAVFTMAAKTTRDQRDDSKSWLYNNLVTSGAKHDSRAIGNAAQSYDLRLEEVSDFDYIAYDGKNRGFFGAIADSNGGVSLVPMYRVPVTPAASLGDWIASNLVSSSEFPRVNYPLGNSFAHPLIPGGSITESSPVTSGARMLDHSYLMNAAFWDRYYFSSATDYSSAAFKDKRSKAEVLEDFFSGDKAMLNSRLIPYLTGDGDAASVASEYNSKAPAEFSTEFASNSVIKGAFNINSDSVDAWRSVLSSMRDAAVIGWKDDSHDVDEKTAFVRNGLPIAGSADDANPKNSLGVNGQVRWAGFRVLNDDRIEELAIAIVKQIRLRGIEDGAPSLCLADFVNRRIGASNQLHGLKGILQSAIEDTPINTDFHRMDSNNVSSGSLPANRTRGLANRNALDGNTADGAAPMLTQGDLLTGLAPFITARGDTFTIRAYGEARNNSGNAVEARAWCEATVQRIPEYVDSTNPPETAQSNLTLNNVNFGRRFTITSFRWLNASEI
ncbi:MAG: hypothetical protein V4640_04865 [Verrucomicrobiota bacterium]